MLITLSGLDGAGKSTLIGALRSRLADRQIPVTVLTMYDHVGVYALLRRMRNRLLQDTGRMGGRPAAQGALLPFYRRVVARIIGVLRSRVVKRLVYLVDLSIWLMYRIYFEMMKRHVVIIDRYFYDSLADVTDGGGWLYTRIFLRLVPTPDIPVYVDVPPEVALARKGEYSLQYLVSRRVAYQRIFSMVPNAVVLGNDDLYGALDRLACNVVERMSRK